MPGGLVVLGWRVALSFDGEGMDDHRVDFSLRFLEGSEERFNVMTVDWAEIAEAKFFYEYSGHNRRFESVLHVLRRLKDQITDARYRSHDVFQIIFETVIGLAAT